MWLLYKHVCVEMFACACLFVHVLTFVMCVCVYVCVCLFVSVRVCVCVCVHPSCLQVRDHEPWPAAFLLAREQRCHQPAGEGRTSAQTRGLPPNALLCH